MQYIILWMWSALEWGRGDAPPLAAAVLRQKQWLLVFIVEDRGGARAELKERPNG